MNYQKIITPELPSLIRKHREKGMSARKTAFRIKVK